MRKNIIILFCAFLLAACNYRLANKRNIVKDQKGYLVFTQDEVTFYPTNDTVDAKFLNSPKHKEGYRIDFRTSWLDSLSTDYSYATERKYPKKFSIIPVEVQFYLGEMWHQMSDKNTFSYKWNNVVHSLKYEINDWRQILSISVVRENDIKRLKDLKRDESLEQHHW